ncbi:ATP-dependent DNA ligase LigA [Halobaculum magnesiiphilum]|uniref:DNA ligase n=1 Tax=Halobaculum magnesiiphilum TaxID=1017351 RepID=A0A8T8WFC0_9EURY|nr:ATP-dependent DNA ligase LigA [Halobaculum magnesiiphilum]QZP38433.1 ATP-dependent DNA ligase [Halobaculum magnesiiphilum]
MDFATFAERAESMAAEPGDLATVALVAETLAAAEGDAASGSDDLPVVARFLRGAVFPGWDGRTLSVGPALCHAALARAAGANVTADDIEARLAETGEIGAVAADLELGGQTGLAAFAGGDGAGAGDDADGAGNGNGNGLTVREVYDELVAVAEATGDGSESFREDTLFGLFTRASPVEAKILARLVLGEMRIGVGSGTLRDATAEAFLGASVTTPTEERDEDDRTEELVALVERALQVTNDHGRVARIARDEGEAGLREVSLSVGRPVRSMLAQSGTVADALESWEEAVVETKYDGARVQIHYEEGADRSADAGAAAGDADGTDRSAPSEDDPVSIYSRNMEDVTAALPELVEHVREHATAPAILDGEAVAVDDGGEPLPFQEILRRFRRKHDVDRMREEVRVELRAFDCLHAGGDDLLDAPLVERHDRLHEVLDEGVSELLVSDDADEIEAFETEALAAGHEGVMLKRPESTYDPGNRGKEWLKRKPDVETLDLVVTGAEWGEGRRAELFGTFEVSVCTEGADDDTNDGEGAYATVGKVATGITDEELADLTDLLEPYVRSEAGQRVTFAPEAVFEVGYEEIQRSPTYDSGYALRFPRFVAVREDKAPADADSLARLRRLADGAE